MSQKHTLTMLLLSCSIIALHAMDEIKLTEVKPSELEPYESLACDVYQGLAKLGAEDTIRGLIKTKLFPHIVSLEKENHHALVASLGEKNIGFITYEVVDEKTITFHLSPIQEPHTKSAYKQVLRIIEEKYPNGCDVCASCPDFLPGLAELLTDLGYKRVKEYKCSDDYPKPPEGVPAYMLKLLAKDSNC